MTRRGARVEWWYTCDKSFSSFLLFFWLSQSWLCYSVWGFSKEINVKLIPKLKGYCLKVHRGKEAWLLVRTQPLFIQLALQVPFPPPPNSMPADEMETN